MKEVIIYTDGACSGNPGPGGWGCVLMYKGSRLELSGHEPQTTNNRMELTAAIKGLEALKSACIVDIYSDSAYLVHAFEKGWLTNWQRNGWLKSNKKPVENQDLWQLLLAHGKVHQIRWHKVKGHASNVHNNRCDELATGEIKQRRQAERLD